ncbi:hypothetical protein ACOMHN_063942 [Nucella lapillus]
MRAMCLYWCLFFTWISLSAGYQEVEENTALTFTCDQYSGSVPTTPVINRQESGYTLPVSAAVTRVYSSRGLYSCTGQLGSSSSPATLDLSPTASNTSNTADRSGRCDVTMSIPVTSGTYPCSVTVNPGNTQAPCGSFTITRPSPPTISCPSDFIPENTSLTCTCNANNIGQPGGRLRWYTGTGSDISTEVVSANYDVTTLEMTRTVTRGDNGRKFRCVNNWTVKVNAASDYTARVAWGPDTVSIDGNTPFYTDTTGSKAMTLTCQANGVKPSSDLTYKWDVLCDYKQQSTCTFRPRPGPNDPPLSAPKISGYVNGHILYEADNLTLNCAVTGGDPKVTSVTLTCLGRSKQKTTNGQTSSLEFSLLSSSDHNLTCVCSGQWALQGYYTLTDSRTLTVYCEMRIARDSFSSAEDGVTVLDSSTQQGELHFQVLTTDTPHTASFLYLGTDSTGAGYPPTSGLLSATCAQTSVAYKSRCVLTASNVTQQWIGYYNVTIATSTQTVSFTFRLQMKKSPDNKGPSDSRGPSFEWFGAGLGVGLAVLVVENLVLVLCLWIQHWRLPCAVLPSPLFQSCSCGTFVRNGDVCLCYKRYASV